MLRLAANFGMRSAPFDFLPAGLTRGSTPLQAADKKEDVDGRVKPGHGAARERTQKGRA
jgi:hypothetical protein